MGKEAFKRSVLHFGNLILKKKKWVLLASLAIIILFSFGRQLKPFIFTSALVAMASVSLLYNRVIHVSLGFELVTLATVLSGMHYGSVTGAFVGLVSLLLAELISGRISATLAVSFIGISTVGFLAGFLSSWPVAIAGIMLSIAYNLIIIPLYLMMGSNPAKCGLFTITNILFNIWVFTSIAPFINGLMA